jgi:hypothetical protein
MIVKVPSHSHRGLLWDPKESAWVMRLRLLSVAKQLEARLKEDMATRAAQWQSERIERLMLMQTEVSSSGREGSWSADAPPDLTMIRRLTDAYKAVFDGLDDGDQPGGRGFVVSYLMRMGSADEEESEEEEEEDSAAEAEGGSGGSGGSGGGGESDNEEKEDGGEKAKKKKSITCADFLSKYQTYSLFDDYTWHTQLGASPDTAGNVLYFTPVQNQIQLDVLTLQGRRKRHPWANFVRWYLSEYPTFHKKKGLFTAKQCIRRAGHYTLTFVYPKRDFKDAGSNGDAVAPTVVFQIERDDDDNDDNNEDGGGTGKEEEEGGEVFQLYGNLQPDSSESSIPAIVIMGAADIEAELKRLKARVMEAEEAVERERLLIAGEGGAEDEAAAQRKKKHQRPEDAHSSSAPASLQRRRVLTEEECLALDELHRQGMTAEEAEASKNKAFHDSRAMRIDEIAFQSELRRQGRQRPEEDLDKERKKAAHPSSASASSASLQRKRLLLPAGEGGAEDGAAPRPKKHAGGGSREQEADFSAWLEAERERSRKYDVRPAPRK